MRESEDGKEGIDIVGGWGKRGAGNWGCRGVGVLGVLGGGGGGHDHICTLITRQVLAVGFNGLRERSRGFSCHFFSPPISAFFLAISQFHI